jgi:RinA family phage transcriptional activator
MSELSFTWWPYARNMIRAYQKRRKCDSLNRVALLETDAVATAINKELQKEDGEHRVKLIELTYWRRSRPTLQRAAMDIPVSYSTAKRWNKEFFLDVAEAMGLYDPPEEEQE